MWAQRGKGLNYRQNIIEIPAGPLQTQQSDDNAIANDMHPASSLLRHLQVSCSWGYTTTGGAKGVGESTTSAVVISLVLIFIADFALSFLFFQGQGDALRSLA